MHSAVDLQLGMRVCRPDAAAGAGSDETEGGQPDGSGSHRPQEEEEDYGLSFVLCYSGGNIQRSN